MILVINEWIFHDLLFDNGTKAFRETEEFVKRLANSEDLIVMPNEVRWKRKAYQLMMEVSPAQRQISKIFHNILRDPARCLILSSSLPEVTPSSRV